MPRQPRERPETNRDYLERYPRLCGHVIAESLGYATPSCAASIVKSAHERDEHWCEWILACYQGKAESAVRDAIRNRHSHSGPMASYSLALNIIQRELETGEGPLFASWF